jgi:hypothetical protein
MEAWQGLLINTLVAMALIALVLLGAAAVSHFQSKREREARHDCRQRALAALSHQVSLVIARYKEPLLAKRRLTIHRDLQGREIRLDWEREVDQFVRDVLIPEMKANRALVEYHDFEAEQLRAASENEALSDRQRADCADRVRAALHHCALDVLESLSRGTIALPRVGESTAATGATDVSPRQRTVRRRRPPLPSAESQATQFLESGPSSQRSSPFTTSDVLIEGETHLPTAPADSDHFE